MNSFCRKVAKLLLSLLLLLSLSGLLSDSSALAGLTDDRFDGNIFPLYAGNGSLVPPKVTLAESLKRDNPTLVVFYVDDSSDCKEFVAVVNQLDAFYGRAADFIAMTVDAIAPQDHYESTDLGYYYKGLVPQTVLFNQAGEVILDETGTIPFEQIDDKLREAFNLLPRTESVELKRRQVNEINTELVRE
ncbi:MAG: thioredoxin family protein [Leptolyngbyaceae cyanobacterium RM2_2_4]|nr:thioredoxin family protein [Leptolyngbyaceae cyanobacterium SM1_4_3]NJN91154.1 thioredoxin family protein [Leptolyngbyaceae cyanobacterium SL_5_14]NJO52940.1 thioredoxin family protein [Leptolyngbyaceae cyanobacterium RM2_2_4]NJO67122.1 thioredoxin family protein [Leptolyngbyaceae cyanobacterium RM1_405_57]